MFILLMSGDRVNLCDVTDVSEAHATWWAPEWTTHQEHRFPMGSSMHSATLNEVVCTTFSWSTVPFGIEKVPIAAELFPPTSNAFKTWCSIFSYKLVYILTSTLNTEAEYCSETPATSFTSTRCKNPKTKCMPDVEIICYLLKISDISLHALNCVPLSSY
jgi:hypothetical protein